MFVPFAFIFRQAELFDAASMTGLQVLLVAGTHGNESNGPWLVDQWLLDPALLQTHGVTVLPVRLSAPKRPKP